MFLVCLGHIQILARNRKEQKPIRIQVLPVGNRQFLVSVYTCTNSTNSDCLSAFCFSVKVYTHPYIIFYRIIHFHTLFMYSDSLLVGTLVLCHGKMLPTC